MATLTPADAWQRRSCLEDSLSPAPQQYEQLAQAEKRLGGSLYRVSLRATRRLEQAAERFNKKLVGLGGSELELKTLATEVAEVWAAGSRRGLPLNYLLLGGKPLRAGRWQLVGRLDRLGSAGLPRPLPGCQGLISSPLGEPGCDHCGSRRRRNDCVIALDPQGQLVRLARTCLAEATGSRQSQLRLAQMDALCELALRASEAESESQAEDAQHLLLPTLEYLTHVACLIRVRGWTSRSEACYGSNATASLAYANLRKSGQDARNEEAQPDYVLPQEDDRRQAQAVLEWARGLASNERYLSELSACLSADWLDPERLGLPASAVVAHERAMRAAASASQRANSGWVGSEGERIQLVVEVYYIKHREGYYGRPSPIYKMQDAQGNRLTWFGSSYPMENKERYLIEATVKTHEEYQGTRSTVLTRLTVLQPVS